MIDRHGVRRCVVLAAALASLEGSAGAQAPSVTPGAPAASAPSGNTPGAGGSLLGPAPGAGEHSYGPGPGTSETMLGGRPGASVPRVPASVAQPGTMLPPPLPPANLAPALRLRPAEPPAYGPLAPPGADDDGPPDGLTLDDAIERLVRSNLDLRSRFFEIPQAQADVLTASLRANPIFYADSQFIPYGGYSKARPGGPTQYDINITQPIDLNHKRRARMEVACRAKRVLEAQYQDAVRLEIDNLYVAYVDVLAARETVRYSRASVEGLAQVDAILQKQLQTGTITAAELNPIRIQRNSAEIALAEAEEALGNAKRTLAALLNLPPAAATALELRGSVRDSAPPPPPAEALVGTALASRPDIVAYNLGVSRADADVRLAQANRFSDVYVLFQPYTFQNNAPFDAKSAHSWALGVTVPLPLYNRNQGNIQRARLNVAQTQNELVALKRQVIAEVERAERDYAVTRASAGRIERDLLPAAAQVRDNSLRRYRLGEVELLAYLNAQRDFNEIIRQYRDTLVRHRRAMLRLNTAVGQRILP